MAKETRKYARLTEATWAEVRALWETGEPTLEELAARYGVAKRTLQVHFDKHGAQKGAKAKEIAAAVTAQVFNEAFLDQESLTKRAKETRESAYRNAVIIENLIMAQLDEAQQDPSKAIRAATAIKALSLAAAGLERLHDVKQRALGLDKDRPLPDEMPQLVLRDLTQAEIDELQREHDDLAEAELVAGSVSEEGLHNLRSEMGEGAPDEEDSEDDVVVEGPKATRRVTPDGFRLVRDAAG